IDELMLVVISPAKNLDYDSVLPTVQYSQPRMLNRAQQLIDKCRTLTPAQLSQLMKISDKLAGLNAARFAQWQQPFTPDNARPAIYAFDGDVYSGLAAEKLSDDAIAYAQEHLRILSGLYGVLRPLDLMQPYRLEMGTKLDTARGRNLYEFWGDAITDMLNEDLETMDSELGISLASQEYWSSVLQKRLYAHAATPVFEDEKIAEYPGIRLWPKAARGMMARFIMTEQPTSVVELRQFN